MNIIELSKKGLEVVNGGVILEVVVAGATGCIAGIASNIGDRAYDWVFNNNSGGASVPLSKSCFNGAVFGATLVAVRPHIEPFVRRVL
jgi:hypothetical protein